MHPSASAAQLFSPSPASSSPSSSSPYNSAGGRSSSSNFDPASAALLLDPRYRSLMPPLSNGSPSNHGTHNHAHIHSHSHTHLHLPHNNDSPSSPAAPGPPSLMPFPNPLSSEFTSGASATNVMLVLRSASSESILLCRWPSDAIVSRSSTQSDT